MASRRTKPGTTTNGLRSIIISSLLYIFLNAITTYHVQRKLYVSILYPIIGNLPKIINEKKSSKSVVLLELFIRDSIISNQMYS